MDDVAEILYRTPTIVAGAWENLSLVRYIAPPTAQELRAADAINDRILAKHPGGYALLGFVDALQKLPSAEVRTVSAEILKRREQTQRATVLILEGTGFWASAMRMAITSIIGMVSGRGNRRFARDLGEAADLLVAHVNRRDGTPVSREQILAVTQGFRHGS
jgi:hypothetical protein